MSKKLFVGNLSFDTNDDEVRTVFEKYGPVEEFKLITDRYTGKSRGFGFVTMEDEAADKAMAELNGTDLGGRTLRVNEATERTPSRQGSGGGGGGGGNGGGNRRSW